MNGVILVVDDDSTNLMLAQRILGREFRIAAANSGEAALKYLERKRPDLILLDIKMPDMDGFETMKKLRERERGMMIPVIFLTADKSVETEMGCFKVGAFDFVGKPFVPDILMSRVKRALELERYHNSLTDLVREQAELLTGRMKRISELQEHIIIGLANLIESRDGNIGKHVKHIQAYVRLIANELRNRGFFLETLDDEYIQNITRAAPLHDIGKIKIPDSILQKSETLTEEEHAVMKKHTEYSAELIRCITSEVEDENYIRTLSDIAMYHHERWDGKGYPKGLSGEDIPLCARIMAVADVFDAMYEERCYRPPEPPIQSVLDILAEGRGTQFDTVIVDVFISLKTELLEILTE